MKPLVSVICLCHNQSRFVEEAIRSVWAQTYEAVELVVVDDGSMDGSQEVIQRVLTERPDVKFVKIGESIGNCEAFNRGWRQSAGQFLIDLAADDVLEPERIRVGVEALQSTGAGVTFCDCLLIAEDGQPIRTHYDRDKDGKLLEQVPDGDVYEDLVRRYFICPPGMMFAREVIEQLNGYDESLSYEDFDFWVRSSRTFRYAFTDAVLVKRRVVKGSLSASQEFFRNSHALSTLIVCQKAHALNRTSAEHRALRDRCWAQIRQCIKKGNVELIPHYLKIIRSSR
jgi:glycosyltransferase involved in cell wall biosynthesis